MKKITFLIVLCYSSFVFSQTTGIFVSGDFSYIISNTTPTTVAISNYTGPGGNLTLPATVENNGITYRIIRIGDGAFENKSLKSITFPTSITSIGDRAFKDNFLTSFSINSNITSIGDSVFENNKLTNIIIPDSVTSIGEFAFFDNSLTNIIIPNSVTTLKQGAFRKNSIESIIIPNSITSIEDFVFTENSLASVVIPSNITSIGAFAFSNNLLTDVTIANNVTTIEQHAFMNNLLTSIVIPDSVTTMETSIFIQNPITDVTSESLTPAFLPSDAFDNKNNINLVIPGGTTTIYTSQNWIDFRLTIEDPSLSINTVAFLKDNISIDNYTNPDFMTIKSTNVVEIQGVNVFNISGAKILTSKQSQIAIASLANGIYIIEIITNKGKFTKKFAK